MSGTQSDQRKKATERAEVAIERVGQLPELCADARMVAGIVHNSFYSDAEAWDAVQALEESVICHGLITPEQMAADVTAWRAQNAVDLAEFLAELFPEKPIA